MCGITGYIGDDNAQKILIDNLKLLEYRGYDSAGIALFDDSFFVTKSVGAIANLEKKLKPNNYHSGVAHTRWATHGDVSLKNCHPHISAKKEWCIVHNGIIENSTELKTKFEITTKGSTDTEVIANLLEKNNHSDPLEKLIDVCNLLDGSYALACICGQSPDELFLAKNKSPLYVAINDHEVLVASDPICFKKKFDYYYCLNDMGFCHAKKNSLVFYNKFGKEIDVKKIPLNDFESTASKDKYPYFMEKEIYEIPEVLTKINKNYKKNRIFSQFNANFLKNFDKIELIGCGTAYHACSLMSNYFRKYLRLNANAHYASEYRYSTPLLDKKTLCIFLSQSGETADTLGVCDLAKEKKATSICVTNVTYSTLAQKCDFVFPLYAGPEIAVASTKAYTAMLYVLYLFVYHLKKMLGKKSYKKQKFDIKKLTIPPKDNFNFLVKKLKKANNIFFIGRDVDFVSCREASLKLKEITYKNTEVYPAGELKHGYLALISKKTYVFVLATQKELLDKTLNASYEAMARGGKIIFVSQHNLPHEKTKNFYKVIKLQEFPEDVMPITSIIFFQMLAYLICTKNKLCPDKPRNLAKSVTVE